MLSVFEVLGKDIDHSSIERHDQRLSVLCDVDVDDVVIKIEVLDLNVHEASLSDSGTEDEIRHHPALVFGKGAFLDIGLFEKCLKLRVAIGFDMVFIYLDCLHFEVRQPAFVHEEMEGCYQIS